MEDDGRLVSVTMSWTRNNRNRKVLGTIHQVAWNMLDPNRNPTFAIWSEPTKYRVPFSSLHLPYLDQTPQHTTLLCLWLLLQDSLPRR